MQAARPIAAFAVLAAALSAQAAEPLKDEARSTVAVEWVEGAARISTENVRFRAVGLYEPGREDMRTLLLREETEIVQRLDMEGPERHEVRVEAWDLTPDGGRAPAWSIRETGDEGDIAYLSWADFYRITEFGCCGAMNVNYLYSLANGRLLLTHTAPVAALEVPNSGGLQRLIGVHMAYAAAVPPSFGDDPGTLALVSYASHAEPLSGFLIKIAPPLTLDEVMDVNPPLLLEDGKTEAVDSLTLWAVDGRTDPQAIGGASLQLTFAGHVLTIPIRGDAFDLAAAKLPPGFSVVPLPAPE